MFSGKRKNSDRNTHTHTHTQTHKGKHTHTRIHVHTNAHTHVHTHIYVFLPLSEFVCVNGCSAHVCVSAFGVRVCVCVLVSVRACVYACMRENDPSRPVTDLSPVLFIMFFSVLRVRAGVYCKDWKEIKEKRKGLQKEETDACQQPHLHGRWKGGQETRYKWGERERERERQP